MRRTELLATALGAVLLTTPVLVPSLAQAAGDGMSRRHAAAAIDRSAAGGDATAWVEQAQDALRRNRTGEATELLERAETRLLTRSTPSSMADQPMQGPAIQHISAARAAIGTRDRRGAARETEQALAALRGMPQDDMMSGTGAGMTPMQGGGMTMRDGGMAGSSMSRADLIILAQAGGGGGTGADSSGQGGVSSATPGSPAAGNLGSTPQNMQGRSEQPAQGSAVPLAPNAGRGGPDPSATPGAAQTAPGGTGVMPGDRQNRR
jgi:hypothetical protein